MASMGISESEVLKLTQSARNKCWRNYWAFRSTDPSLKKTVSHTYGKEFLRECLHNLHSDIGYSIPNIADVYTKISSQLIFSYESLPTIIINVSVFSGYHIYVPHMFPIRNDDEYSHSILEGACCRHMRIDKPKVFVSTSTSRKHQ